MYEILFFVADLNFFCSKYSENNENSLRKDYGMGGLKMNKEIKKIALLTGGGDCPGLNAVIRSVTKSAILNYGYEVIGYKFGYRGLYNNDFVKLDLSSVSGLLSRGGTILYSSNKDNLFDYQVIEDGKKVKKDVSDVAVENLKKEGGHILDRITTYDGKVMIYYREYGSYPTDVKTKVFYKN